MHLHNAISSHFGKEDIPDASPSKCPCMQTVQGSWQKGKPCIMSQMQTAHTWPLPAGGRAGENLLALLRARISNGRITTPLHSKIQVAQWGIAMP